MMFGRCEFGTVGSTGNAPWRPMRGGLSNKRAIALRISLPPCERAKHQKRYIFLILVPQKFEVRLRFFFGSLDSHY